MGSIYVDCNGIRVKCNVYYGENHFINVHGEDVWHDLRTETIAELDEHYIVIYRIKGTHDYFGIQWYGY